MIAVKRNVTKIQLLELWGTIFLPDWQPSLIFVWFTSKSWALAILLDNMHKKFEINRTKVKGGCQSGGKVVTHNYKSDLPLTVTFCSHIFEFDDKIVMYLKYFNIGDFLQFFSLIRSPTGGYNLWSSTGQNSYKGQSKATISALNKCHGWTRHSQSAIMK